ncbi:hypothetical protein MBH78_19675 [Oceanimonas sp. NS1]|nr:hypothetical protein [Oceanimonas sp. NS1]
MLRTASALMLLLLTACAGAGSPRLALDPVGSFPAALSESSGLVAWPGGFVSHNDSGKAAELFVLNQRGGLVRRLPVPAPTGTGKTLPATATSSTWPTPATTVAGDRICASSPCAWWMTA